MNKNLRKRKIKVLYKISSIDDDSFEDNEFSEEEVGSKKNTPLLSDFQCRNNSAAWIDSDGKIHYIPNESYYNFDEDREEFFPMTHSNYIYKVHLKEKDGDPQKNYMDWLINEGDKWVKVSNYTNFSIDQGFPTQEQLNSFAKIHIECLPKMPSGYMSPEEDIITFVIEKGITKNNVRNNMHLLNLEDHPEYQEDIKIKDYPKIGTFKIRIKAWEFFKKYCPDLEDAYYEKLME